MPAMTGHSRGRYLGTAMLYRVPIKGVPLRGRGEEGLSGAVPLICMNEIEPFVNHCRHQRSGNEGRWPQTTRDVRPDHAKPLLLGQVHHRPFSRKHRHVVPM